ncbi:hypothetical protein BDV93DRAFT_38744 [Ceratobasidium sp. AG-I]|nr:hypothetical protein BDV93DRAFT_38744 [Ceratobasidium sp. AG-I]
MCIRNLHDAGLVNGSVGIVVDFKLPSEARATRGKTEDDRRYITIVSDLEPKKGTTNGIRPNQMYESSAWPIVEFHNSVRAMMAPALFTWEGADGEVQASRQQIPLILAWALTVCYLNRSWLGC